MISLNPEIIEIFLRGDQDFLFNSFINHRILEYPDGDAWFQMQARQARETCQFPENSGIVRGGGGGNHIDPYPLQQTQPDRVKTREDIHFCILADPVRGGGSTIDPYPLQQTQPDRVKTREDIHFCILAVSWLTIFSINQWLERC